jgi:SAM-dependent methyltransferase
MQSDEILRSVCNYYTKKVEEHGPTPRGVDWNSRESQELRFQQLMNVIESVAPFSLNDYGCGYGALSAYLRQAGYDCAYHGFDVSESMVDIAGRLDAGPTSHFTSRASELAVADYTVASGIFNVKLNTSINDWTVYVLETLDRIDSLSTRGFAFNVLTKYSDGDRMRPDLYYADPCFLFDYCKRKYSRRVALLHDYRLYEFTLVVRKE